MAQKKFIIDGGFTTNDDSTLVGNLDITGHIIPSVDSDGTTGYDLGSPDMKWRDLYLSQGSLYIDGQKVIESNSGTIVVQADPDQSLTTKVSGSGVMTLESATTVNMASTLQMQTGKKITDQGGNAVVFGDKLDMDQNQIINIGTPTADGHAANKAYVDDKFGDVVGGAPAALDTLNELANALGDDADYAASITTALSTKATTAYVDSQISSLSSSVAAGAYGDSDVKSYLEAYDGDINLDALKSITYTDFSGTAQQFIRITEAGGNANGVAIGATYFTTVDPGLDLRFATSNDRNANFDLNNGHLSLGNSQIKNVGTPTDAADAANKAYVDSAVAGLVDSAPEALDTLNELAAALGDDANFASATTAALATKATTAYVDGEITTLSASVAAGAYGDSDVADYLTSGTVTSFEIKEASTGATGFVGTTLTHTLENPNLNTVSGKDKFGGAIGDNGGTALNDTHMLVTANNEDKPGLTNTGAVHVYNLSDMSLAHTLELSSPVEGAEFGKTVAMNNSYAVVGSQEDYGKIYIYNTSDFTLRHTVANPTPSTGNSFGKSGTAIAIDDTHVLVGDYQVKKAHLINLATGQVDYTFSESDQNFGTCVAMTPSHIAISAKTSTYTGFVRVYNRSTMAFEYQIDNPNEDGAEYFGNDLFTHSMAATDTHIIVGARHEAGQAGKVYVFNVADGSLAYSLTSPTSTQYFGDWIDADGSHFVVGQYNSDDTASGLGSSGQAHIFNVSDGSLVKTLDNPNAYGTAQGDQFGRKATIKGDYVVVTASHEADATTTEAGRVYVFKAAVPEVLLGIDASTSTLQIGADMTVGNTATFNSDVTISSTPTEPTHATNKAYVDSAVAGLVDSAPEALDTLNELAAALGDDANFAATTTAVLATKATTAYVDSEISTLTSSVATKATTAYVDSEISTLSASVAAGAYGDADVANYLTSGSVTSIEVKEASTGPTGFAASALAHTLENPNAGGGSLQDEYGYSVALNDTYTITGAYIDGGATPNYDQDGTVYIHNLSDGSLAHTLENPHAFSVSTNPNIRGDNFGSAVAMSNSYAIVSAPYATDNTYNYPNGAVYIYDTSDFSLKHSILAPDHVKDDWALYNGVDQNSFGKIAPAIAIDDTHALVGNKGVRKVYVINLETGQIDGTISSTIDNFGYSVAMSSSYIAVSDTKDSNNTEYQVHVYNRADLSFMYSISNPNGNTGLFGTEYFGANVKMTETHVVVSAAAFAHSDSAGLRAGRIYTFNIADGSLDHTLENPDNPNSYSFGEKMDIDGSNLLAYSYVNGGTYEKVSIFDLSNNGSLVKTFDNPNAYGSTYNDIYGHSVAINGNNVVISALREDSSSANDTGRVYVFKAPAPPATLFDVDASTSTLQIGADMTVGNTATFNSNVTISSTPTNSTHAANKAYVDSAVAGLVDSAPGALDTLNELAAALGDDANFSATVTNELATKATTAYVDSEISTLSASTTASLGTKATTAYVDSEISTLSASVAAGAYGDSDLTDYLANNQTFFANIRANNTGSTVGTWADPFGQVNGKTIGLTEAIVWPSAASEHGSYKLVELVGQTGTGTIHAEFFPDVIKPGYSTGGNNVKLEPNAGGVVDVSNSKISNVSTPTDTTDAANKAYVDSEVSTLSAAITSAEDAANAYTNTQVSNLINSAPGALDTLNELAAALGDDANFSSTVVNNIATAKSEAIATASADATAKADAAEADAIASAEAKDAVRATAANAYADQAEADAIATASADATAKADAAEASAIATASADATAKADAALAALTHFHSAVQDVTSAQSTANNSGTVNFTFSELSGAKTYGVYLNRQLLRPAEYSVSGTTVTISTGVLATDDELEVTGLKV